MWLLLVTCPIPFVSPQYPTDAYTAQKPPNRRRSAYYYTHRSDLHQPHLDRPKLFFACDLSLFHIIKRISFECLLRALLPDLFSLAYSSKWSSGVRNPFPIASSHLRQIRIRFLSVARLALIGIYFQSFRVCYYYHQLAAKNINVNSDIFKAKPFLSKIKISEFPKMSIIISVAVTLCLCISAILWTKFPI
ncbi:hypothetical protein V1509DRAFT_623976 [Lipomyces kononenkoae]